MILRTELNFAFNMAYYDFRTHYEVSNRVSRRYDLLDMYLMGGEL
jgi:hypothetical protein